MPQDIPDARGGEGGARGGQLATDPLVTPGRVLFPQAQGGDGATRGPRPSRASVEGTSTG
jgi:hypothetical protein